MLYEVLKTSDQLFTVHAAVITDFFYALGFYQRSSSTARWIRSMKVMNFFYFLRFIMEKVNS